MEKKKDEGAAPILDLDIALSKWEARPDLKAAVLKALAEENDVPTSDTELSQTDTAQKSRLIYAAGLVRLLAFFKSKDSSPADTSDKAKLALGYIKHAETGGLSSQLIGRGATDEKYMEEIKAAREQLQKLADAKAKLLTDENSTVN